MEDNELRKRLDDVRDDVQELRDMLTTMQVTDAEARADAKVVAGKLDNAAQALATAAQSIQARDLSKELGSPTSKWMQGIIVALLTIIAALVGAKLTGLLGGH